MVESIMHFLVNMFNISPTMVIGTPELMLLAGVLLGLVCSLVPQLPGTLGIMFSVMCYSFYDDFTMFTITWLVVMGAITLCGGFGQYAVTGWCSTKFGASRAGAIGAILCMPFGFLLPVPGGMVAGAALGAFVGEYYFSKNPNPEVEQSMRAAVGAALGAVISVLFEFVFAVLLTIIIFTRFFCAI